MTFEKLKIGIINEFDDGSQPHFRRLMDEYDIDFIEFNSQDELIESLIEGDIDLVGTSGLRSFELGFSGNTINNGLQISTFLPRRDPTLVMVSKDNLDFLPRKAKIFCSSEITRYQLKRFRNDFEVLKDSDLELGDLSNEQLVKKLDELYEGNFLDAYVLERSEWNEYKKKGRRRSLGMQIGHGYSRQRFIPPPLRGFSILISRVGFPNSFFADIDDFQAKISFSIESNLISQLSRNIPLGLNASIRRISTISKSLIKDGGFYFDILDEKLTSLERFDNELKHVEHMVEIIAESLDSSGQITYGLEKKFLVGDDEFRILKIFSQEWEEIIDLKLKN